MKKHPTLANIYVTESGEVFKRLAASPSYNGYHTVKVPETIRRHTLVAETYIGPRPVGGHCRHLDGDPTNDHYTNLAWGTARDNHMDARKHGTDTRGERNGQAKLTQAQAQEIFNRRKAGESGASLARCFGVSQSIVCDIFKGRHWPEIEREKEKRYA